MPYDALTAYLQQRFGARPQFQRTPRAPGVRATREGVSYLTPRERDAFPGAPDDLLAKLAGLQRQRELYEGVENDIKSHEGAVGARELDEQDMAIIQGNIDLGDTRRGNAQREPTDWERELDKIIQLGNPPEEPDPTLADGRPLEELDNFGTRELEQHPGSAYTDPKAAQAAQQEWFKRNATAKYHDEQTVPAKDPRISDKDAAFMGRKK